MGLDFVCARGRRAHHRKLTLGAICRSSLLEWSVTALNAAADQEQGETMNAARSLTLMALLTLCLALVACGAQEAAGGEPAAAGGLAASDTQEPSTGAAAVVEESRVDCDITPRMTEGPYYFDYGQVRRDITEGRPGTPLLVAIQLVEAGSCAPIPDAVVDIWHPDAVGQYSGYRGQGDNNSDTSARAFCAGSRHRRQRTRRVRNHLPWLVSRQDGPHPLQGLHGRRDLRDVPDVLARRRL